MHAQLQLYRCIITCIHHTARFVHNVNHITLYGCMWFVKRMLLAMVTVNGASHTMEDCTRVHADVPYRVGLEAIR